MVDRTLSGGERKKVELASVLAMRPRLAILDEPDSGIDMISQDAVISMIYEIRDYGGSVILITHEEEVVKVADRAALMCSGQAFKTGSTQEIVDYYRGRCAPCTSKSFPSPEDARGLQATSPKVSHRHSRQHLRRAHNERPYRGYTGRCWTRTAAPVATRRFSRTAASLIWWCMRIGLSARIWCPVWRSNRKRRRRHRPGLHGLPGAKIEYPVHLCFGVLPAEGEQIINISGEVGEGGGVNLLAHCIFPNATNVRHHMQAQIAIGRNASYGYDEVHYHGEAGGVSVIPHAHISLEKGARLRTSFQLIDGRVGELDIDYEVEAAAEAVVEMLARVYGYGNDIIRIREKCVLKGEDARGVIKSRVAVTGEARSEVFSEMEASGRRSRGHVDCIEIVQDKARARAVPVVDVLDHTAKVTHEAAIGSVDSKQLETLMARGLDRRRRWM